MKSIIIMALIGIVGFGVYMNQKAVSQEETFRGNIVLVGPPGSGKGTLAMRLSEHVHLPVLTVSTVLKQAMEHDQALKEEVTALMEAGKFVDDATIMRVLKVELMKPQYQKGVIFDGFPRTLAQTGFFQETNRVIDKLIVLEVDPQVIVERMSGRRVHLPSGRMYHIIHNPPLKEGIDDVTGEPLSKRKDDEEDIVKKRLDDYRALTAPVLAWATSEEGKQVREIITIDAAASIADVWQAVARYF